METCYILFGSNMGNKNGIFDQACLYINNRCGEVVKVSAPYVSEPWGFEAEEWFLNRVIVVETTLNYSGLNVSWGASGIPRRRVTPLGRLIWTSCITAIV